MANPFPEELTEEEEALRLRRDISNLNIQQSNRSNIIRGLDIGEITNDSARRIIDDINAEQSGVVSPLGVAPPVAAGDPNLQNRQDIRALFNNAVVESENKGQPANGEVGFTPPRSVSSPIDVPPRGSAVPSMADVERAGRGVLNVDVPPHELANQIPSSAIPSFDQPELAAAIPDLPTSGGGFIEAGRDLLRAAGGLVTGDNPVDRFIGEHLLPNTRSEFAEADAEIRAAGEGFADADAGGRGRVISNVAGEAIEGAFQTGSGVIHDIARPFDPLIRGAGGFLSSQLGIGGPETAQAEANESVGDKSIVPETGLPAADAVTALEDEVSRQASFRVPSFRGGGEPAVSTSFVSDESGQESAAVGFEETPTGLSVTFPEVDGPPLEGTEIIRGLDRSFQPFAPGAGEIPFGDDPIERLQNTGFTRDQIPDVIGAQAQALLARGNAYKAATITGEDGRDYLGFTFVDENGEGQTIRLDQLASVGDNLLQLPFEIPYTDPLGDTIALESTRVVEIFRDPETDEVILRAVRQDDTADIEAMKRDNPDVWTAVQAQAAKENKGEPRALELLKLFLEQNQ
jgi:hypothetical protein